MITVVYFPKQFSRMTLVDRSHCYFPLKLLSTTKWFKFQLIFALTFSFASFLFIFSKHHLSKSWSSEHSIFGLSLVLSTFLLRAKKKKRKSASFTCRRDELSPFLSALLPSVFLSSHLFLFLLPQPTPIYSAHIWQVRLAWNITVKSRITLYMCDVCG